MDIPERLGFFCLGIIIGLVLMFALFWYDIGAAFYMTRLCVDGGYDRAMSVRSDDLIYYCFDDDTGLTRRIGLTSR